MTRYASTGRPSGLRTRRAALSSAATLAARGKVDDHAPARDAAELGDALPPVDRVHEHAQADGRVHAPIGDRQRVRVGAAEVPACACPTAAPRARDAQHLRGVVEADDARAGVAPGRARRGRCRCRRRARARPRDGRQRGDEQRLLRVEQIPADRPAEPQRVEAIGDLGVGVVRVAVVIARRAPAASPRRRRRLSPNRIPTACFVLAMNASSLYFVSASVCARRPTSAARAGSANAAIIAVRQPLRRRLRQKRDLVVQHLRVRAQARRDDRPARSEVLIDLQRRVRAGRSRRDQHRRGVEIRAAPPRPGAGR